MKRLYFLIMCMSISVLIQTCNAQAPNPQGPPPNPQGPPQGDIAPCDPEVCNICNDLGNVCLECSDDYVFNRHRGICEDRDEHEDRGDGMSLAVGIINIIFLVVITHAWLLMSRNNNSNYINLNQDLQKNNQLNQYNLQQLQAPPQQQQIIKIGAPSDKTSEFDIRSKKSSVVQPIDDEKNNIFLGNNNNNKSPVVQATYQVEQTPNGSPTLRPNTIQNEQQPTKFVSDDLNGYWMTQAGRFSFQNFSNMHRIRHVMINFQILQRLFSSLLVMSGRRGDDDDSDERKNLLFVGFIVVILLHWLFTFIPCLVIQIFSCCFCLKSDPNGKCSSIFINILFYLASIIMTVITTGAVFRMDGFESQVWILLVLAGFLACIFFDKKSVEFAKKNKNGKIESLIKYRKIDFQNNNGQNQAQV